MTVGFDSLQPFWLLGALPLLWLLQRRRARAERVTLPLFPVLAEWLERRGDLPPRVFRLGRKWRRALAAAALLLLVLAAARAHLVRRVPAAVDRLLVLDNAPGAFVPAEGRPVGDHLRDAALALAGKVPARDRLAVLVTSPRPRLLTDPAGIGGVDPARAAPPAAELAVVAADLVRGAAAAEVVVLSPRAEEWRRAIPPQVPVRIPPDRLALAGNAGVTVLSPRSSPAAALTVRVTGTLHPVMETALRTVPGVALTWGEGPAAVEVIAGTPSSPSPRLPTLVVRPGADFFGFRFLRLWDYPGETSFDPTHPLTRSLSFRNFRPPRVVEFALPEGFTPAAQSEGAPLIAAGEREGKRVAVWTFDPVGGGIFLDPSFPILLRDTLSWLAGEEEGRPGLFPPPATRGAAEVSLPDTSALGWGEAVTRESRRTELAPFLLAAALLLLLYRAAVHLYPPVEEDE